MYKFILGIILTLGITVSARAETFISFEPDTVSLGESTQLILSSDRPITEIPDLSGLQGKFAVAGQQQRTQVISVNGKRQNRHDLILNIFPRKSGKISTGELVLNGKKLPPAILTVLENSADKNLLVSAVATVNTQRAYPDEVILYTVKVMDGAGFLDGKIMPPTVENARMINLDMDKVYQDKNALGQPVQVVERSFAVIPEKEGNLTLPPAEIYATIAGSPAESSADLFAIGMLFNGLTTAQKEIRLETNPIEIEILEKPADWTGWWLPAKGVSLTVQEEIPETVTTGDSLTRTIRLIATGTEAERLPTLTQPANADLKVYPSPEKRETILTPAGEIQGEEELSIVMVPVNAGRITIPAVRVNWFNTQTQRREEAILPAKTITVKAGTATPPKQVVAPSPTPTAQPKARTARQKSAPVAEPPAEEGGIMPYIFSGLIGAGIMAGIGFCFLRFRHKKHIRHNYRLSDDTTTKRRKKKKPLPDLYPF